MLFDLPDFSGSNGSLIPVEVRQLLGWSAQRVFYIHARESSIRGGHAHKSCWQAIAALKGTLTVRGEGPDGLFEFALSAPNKLLELPPMCWATEQFMTEGIMLVLAQNSYDEADYITDYAQFRTLLGNTR